MSSEYRITVGSNPEHILMFCLIVLSMLFIPIANVGMDRTLHYLMQNLSGAVQDFHAYQSEYRLSAQLKGTMLKVGTRITGTYPVIDAKSENSLIIEIDGKPRIVGTSTDAHIKPHSIRIVKEDPVQLYHQSVDMDGRTLGELSRLKGTDHRLFGTMHVLSTLSLPSTITSLNPITRVGNNLRFEYATYDDIVANGLENITVIAAEILITSKVPPGTPFYRLDLDHAGKGVYPIHIAIDTPSDIQVKEGDHLKSGDIISAHLGKLRDLTLIESELKTAMNVREEQSYTYTVRSEELERQRQVQNTELERMKIRLAVYETGYGFAKEISELKLRMEATQGRIAQIVAEQKTLQSKDTENQLQYRQDFAKKLARKEALESSIYLNAPFPAIVVSVVVEGNKATIFIRKKEN